MNRKSSKKNDSVNPETPSKNGGSASEAELDKMVNKAIKKSNNKSKWRKNDKPDLLTFKELRELERIAETSHMGPGAIDFAKPFGSDKQGKMTMGGKYKPVKNDNPGPGEYDTLNAMKATKTKNREVIMKEDQSRKKPFESAPDAGNYEPDKGFGALSPQKMTLGGKYKWKPDSNPAPGQYDVDAAQNQVKHKSSAFKYREEMAFKKPAEVNPDAGMYEPSSKFGTISQKMTLGGKYKWKPDSNPPPGLYDVDAAQNQVKPKSSAFQYRPQSGYVRPKENIPDAGEYEPNKQFGHDERKMTMGSKYKWKPNDNPAPGQYDVDTAQGQTKPKSSAFKYNKEQGFKKPPEILPDAGEYEPDRGFGNQSPNRRMTMGSPYKWKPNDNPPPGLYDVDAAQNQVKPKSSAFQYKQEQALIRPKETIPDAGEYEPHKEFGNTSPQKMTLGGKYRWKPNDNPAPGQYEADQASLATKPKAPSVIMREEARLYQRPGQDSSPGPKDAHDAHLFAQVNKGIARASIQSASKSPKKK